MREESRNLILWLGVTREEKNQDREQLFLIFTTANMFCDWIIQREQ